MIHRLSMALSVVLCFFATTVASHTFYSALTRISYNQRAGTIEVIHRLPAHDMEAILSFHAGAILGFDDTPDLTDRAGRYLSDNFKIEVDRSPISLQFIGAEQKGEDLIAYFEGKSPDMPQDMFVINTIFLEELPQQENTVVVTIGDKRGAARFVKDEDRKTISLR